MHQNFNCRKSINSNGDFILGADILFTSEGDPTALENKGGFAALGQ
jgi:hypothetical protein